MKKYIITCLAILLIISTACKHDVESIMVNTDNITLTVGQTHQLEAKVKPDKAPQDVKWKSSHPEIATVSDGGLVTAISDGICEICAYVGEHKAICKVTVKEEHSGPDSVLTFTVNGVDFKMILIKGGCFQMGATAEQESDAYDNEKPVHNVTLSDYYIGETEVTQALWQAVTETNPSSFTGEGQLPVEMVNWNDCQEFIKNLNELTGKSFRLPTEAEWEYAARGGDKSQGYKYAGSNTLSLVAWYNGNSNSSTHIVGTKAPNELGLYDMSGNVLEWCADWYRSSYAAEDQTDPQGPQTGTYRVARGGSMSYYERGCRVSYRLEYSPTNTNKYTGLRLAVKCE